LIINLGLIRNELLYIPDPNDIYSPDYPGETFRFLKEQAEKQSDKSNNVPEY